MCAGVLPCSAAGTLTRKASTESMHWLNEIGRALIMGAMMGWQMLWALILGFGLSAVVQATVSREKVAKLMPDGSPRSIAIASGLGAASSSCSYAAVAIARTL